MDNVVSGEDLTGVTAVILAGGMGKRLSPVVGDRPKVLAEVRGRPFLAYLLDKIAGAGFRHVVLCTGYMGEQVEKVFGKSCGRLHITYSHEPSPLGTGGALRLAASLFKSEDVLVMNGDSFCDMSLNRLWFWYVAHNANTTLVLVKVSDTGRYGHVNVTPEGRVVSFNEKSDQGTPGWINAGVYLLSSSLVLTITEGRNVSLENEIFPMWVEKGLYGYQTESRFLDIGTPEGYNMAEQFFISGKTK